MAFDAFGRKRKIDSTRVKRLTLEDKNLKEIDYKFRQTPKLANGLYEHLETTMHVKNLSPADGLVTAIPWRANGTIYRGRFLIPLRVQTMWVGKENKTLNVWFIMDASCLHTLLSRETIEAFYGSCPRSYAGEMFRLQVPGNEVLCQMSPPGTRLEHLNILGSDYFFPVKFAFATNFSLKSCILYQDGTEDVKKK